jgi:TolB-like protein
MKTHPWQILAMVLMSIVGPARAAYAQSTDAASIDTSAAGVPVIAVLPFAEYAGTDKARAVFLPLVETRIKKEAVRIPAPEATREILREHRIRAGGDISSPDARTLAEEAGADYLLLGSYDFFVDETVMEAGLSLRLIDPRTMRILWAVSDAATGDDLAGLFGIGRATSIDRLAEKLVDHAFRDFDAILSNSGKSADRQSTSPTFAVIPFDNMSDQQNAGNICTRYLLSEMVGRGWTVIEPGVVNDAALRLGKVLRGEVDKTMLEYLRDSVGVDLVITGTVNEFQPGRSDVAPPSVALDARILHAKDGKIISAVIDTRDGGDTGTIIKTGPGNSLGRLTREALENIVKRFDTALNEYVAQNH